MSRVPEPDRKEPRLSEVWHLWNQIMTVGLEFSLTWFWFTYFTLKLEQEVPVSHAHKKDLPAKFWPITVQRTLRLFIKPVLMFLVWVVTSVTKSTWLLSDLIIIITIINITIIIIIIIGPGTQRHRAQTEPTRRSGSFCFSQFYWTKRNQSRWLQNQDRTSARCHFYPVPWMRQIFRGSFVLRDQRQELNLSILTQKQADVWEENSEKLIILSGRKHGFTVEENLELFR